MKQKAPAFQFYAKEWLSRGEIRLMSFKERGMYEDLRAHYWQDGWLPADIQELARLIGATTREMEAAWPRLKGCFRKAKNNRILEKDLKVQRKSQILFQKTRSESGKKGAAKRHSTKELDSTAKNVPLAKSSSPSPSPTPISSSLRSEEKKLHSSPPAAVNGFVRFWSAYPKRKAKGRCLNWWKIHKPDETLLQTMLTAIEQQKQWPEWQRGYAPHPHTWLNGECWLDEPAPQPQSDLNFLPAPDPARQARLKQIEAEAIAKRKEHRVAP